MLLNTLAHERFVRRAFVAELVDELDVAAAPSEVLRAARQLLERLNGGITDAEYGRSIARLIELTRTGQRVDAPVELWG